MDISGRKPAQIIHFLTLVKDNNLILVANIRLTWSRSGRARSCKSLPTYTFLDLVAMAIPDAHVSRWFVALFQQSFFTSESWRALAESKMIEHTDLQQSVHKLRENRQEMVTEHMALDHIIKEQDEILQSLRRYLGRQEIPETTNHSCGTIVPLASHTSWTSHSMFGYSPSDFDPSGQLSVSNETEDHVLPKRKVESISSVSTKECNEA